MAGFRSFEEIISWREARELNRILGELIAQKKFQSNFSLIRQIEASAGSIMDNIAEGFERGGNKEFIQFLYISKGSCGEFRSQLYRILDRKEFDILYKMSKEIIVMIQKLINYLEESELKGPKYKSR